MNTTQPILTPGQRLAVERARALAAIPAVNDVALGVYLEHDDLTTVYVAGYGYARNAIHDLLAIIDDLARGLS